MKEKIILFWSGFDFETDKTLETWRARGVKLSPFHALTLASHCKFNGGAKLYTYQKFISPKVPKGIEVKDAHEILPAELAFSALSRGHNIAHVSDAVRLTVASRMDGIVMDMDATVLRELPREDGFFTSIPAKLSGGVAPKWGQAHPPIKVHDNSWDGRALSNFPAKAKRSNREAFFALASKVVRTLSDAPKKGTQAWNFVMWELKNMAKRDVESKVFPPLAFGPIPAWLRQGKCYSMESPTRLTGDITLFGYPLPSVNEIMEKSYAVQHYFESAFKGAENRLSPFFWWQVPEKCLVSREALHIFGDDWRQKLLRLSMLEAKESTEVFRAVTGENR